MKISSAKPIKVYYDTNVVISIAHNFIFYDKMIHVEVDKDFTKEKLIVVEICMSHVPTTNKVANILTESFKETI